MSDTIKNVRLKDKDGNILHPEITVDAELNSTSENPVQNKVINAKLDEVFQSVSNGKTRIETAITDMGGTVSKAGDVATFEELFSGMGTISNNSPTMNIFTQLTEPETKYGLWIKSNEPYTNIINKNQSIEPIKLTDIPYNYVSCIPVYYNNDIYLFGTNTDGSKRKAYKFNIVTQTYTKLTDIPFDFSLSGCVIDEESEEIYLVSSSASDYRRTMYKYSISTNSYERLPSLSYNFYMGSVVYYNNYIYIFGGYETKRVVTKYDISAKTFTTLSNLSFDCVTIIAQQYDKKYVALSNGMYEYDLENETVTALPEKPFTATNMIYHNYDDDKLYFISNSSLYCYDRENKSYNTVTILPSYSFDLGALLIVDNNLYSFNDTKAYKIQLKVETNCLSLLYGDKYSVKLYNLIYGFLNYINIDNAVYFNKDKTKQDVYIGNGISWNKI